jgi:hypothetical protein
MNYFDDYIPFFRARYPDHRPETVDAAVELVWKRFDTHLPFDELYQQAVHRVLTAPPEGLVAHGEGPEAVSEFVVLAAAQAVDAYLISRVGYLTGQHVRELTLAGESLRQAIVQILAGLPRYHRPDLLLLPRDIDYYIRSLLWRILGMH